MIESEHVFERAHAAHRLCDQANVPELQDVDERGEITAVFLRIRTALDAASRRITAMGVCDAGVAPGEVGDLLPPCHMVAAEAVREHDRRPRAGDLVIEAAAGPLEIAALARMR